MRALFLADAHLRRPADQNYRVLLEFLEEQCGKTDLLVLLGDIFEFWIGKATVSADHAPLIDMLERLHRQGTQLVYVEGNHDFHLGPVFTRRLNCLVFPNGGSIDLDGRRVYLDHGDLANANDTGYRHLRRLLRSDLARILIRVLPRRLLVAIGDRMGHASRKNSAERYSRWPARETTRPFVNALLAQGFQTVVTGHYHQPFHEKQGDGEHVALGDWITQYSYAVYENHTFELKRYSPKPTCAADDGCSPA